MTSKRLIGWLTVASLVSAMAWGVATRAATEEVAPVKERLAKHEALDEQRDAERKKLEAIDRRTLFLCVKLTGKDCDR